MAERKACTGKPKCLQFPQTPKRSVSIMIAKPSLIASLVIAAVSVVFAKDSDNLALNPSFEHADAVGVIADDWVTRTGIPVERLTDGGHTGAAYARFRDDDPKGGQFLECHRVPARPGGVYTASGWFRTTDKCRPGVYVNFYDLYGERVAHRFERLERASADWQRVEVKETAPADAWEVTVSLYAYAGDVGTFDADDAELMVQGGAEPGSAGLERAATGNKDAYEIGARRELFVDDFLIDGQSGNIERRLHHPEPREIALKLDQPWEGETSAYFAMLQDDERVLMYYRGQAGPGSDGQVCCLAESRDGIHFTRVKAGLFEFDGSKDNNIVWKGVAAHNFTPFLDPNPAAPKDERFKAMGYSHHGRGLGVFGSPDGIHWRELLDHAAITNGAFDSQNLAFWDSQRQCYVDFHRKGRDGVRDVMTCTSQDFRTWSEPVFLEYGDPRKEHLYTNGIFAYARAPHIYLGLPARFVPGRTKIKGRKEGGVSDAVLMSSRDGLHFERWSQAFIRPGTEPEVWTDRNNYPAWNVMETAPGELSVYWTEHYRHPGMRLRRGVIRTDGFVSLHSEGSPGEILTRPLVFTGDRLEINHSTDATGVIRFELCDAEGKALPGFSLHESETLFGNELAHIVTWKKGADVSALAGKPVRLRLRLENADVFSLRFVQAK
jgi:hypothetical protein